jgi:multiple sugar transport system substrate-binding protein
MRKKLIAMIMVVTMILTMLSGCSSSDKTSDTSETGTPTEAAKADNGSNTETDEKITLSLFWWGNQTRNDVTKKAIDLYMQQNPNIEINPEFTDWSGYWDKLATMTAGGNMPDIIQQDYSLISSYQKSGQLADLTSFIEDGTIDNTNIPESIIKSGSIDGKVYAISLGSNAPMMIYDKELVEKAGVTIPDQPTITELYNISEQIYAATGAKARIHDSALNMMQMIARANGSHIFDELKAGDATSVIRTFNNVTRFHESEATISQDLLAEKNIDLLENKPIVDQTTWNEFSLSNLFISISEVAGRELGACMYPIADDAKQQPMYLKPSMFFSIAETSEHKKEAAEFIDWFTNSVECNEILLGERGIPISTVVAEAIKPMVGDTSAKVFDYINMVSEIAEPIDAPDPAGKAEVDADLTAFVEDVIYGDKTAEEASKIFTEKAQKILKEAE